MTFRYFTSTMIPNSMNRSSKHINQMIHIREASPARTENRQYQWKFAYLMISIKMDSIDGVQ